jgi:hypothetical protein
MCGNNKRRKLAPTGNTNVFALSGTFDKLGELLLGFKKAHGAHYGLPEQSSRLIV